MNYDVNGPWSDHIGANAPLDDSCSTLKTGSAMSAVKAWSVAGFPHEKMTLGVAMYGHTFHVTPNNALTSTGVINITASFDKNLQPAGDKWDSTATGVDECGNPNVVNGIFDF